MRTCVWGRREKKAPVRPSLRPPSAQLVAACSVFTMANNMYGYSDYDGPGGESSKVSKNVVEQIEEEVDGPLRSGLWMEGDSLAPPCGTSVSAIHKLLKFANVSSNDVLYDFGCGDGRVCLEALVKHDAKHCVGVEVEQDLCERFRYLIFRLDESKRENIRAVHADLREVLTALLARAREQLSKTNQSVNDTSADSKYQDLPMPTILVMYLLPEAIKEMESDLVELMRLIPGLRIVCNTWGLQQVKGSKSLHVEEADGCASTILHLYTDESLL